MVRPGIPGTHHRNEVAKVLDSQIDERRAIRVSLHPELEETGNVADVPVQTAERLPSRCQHVLGVCLRGGSIERWDPNERECLLSPMIFAGDPGQYVNVPGIALKVRLRAQHRLFGGLDKTQIGGSFALEN